MKLFYRFTVSPNKCSGSCNTIDGSHTQICVPNKVKNMNRKIFSLISGVNETRFLVQHGSCECKRELNSVYNLNQKWNHNEYRC